jgi:hypothetical protein
MSIAAAPFCAVSKNRFRGSPYIRRPLSKGRWRLAWPWPQALDDRWSSTSERRPASFTETTRRRATFGAFDRRPAAGATRRLFHFRELDACCPAGPGSGQKKEGGQKAALVRSWETSCTSNNAAIREMFQMAAGMSGDSD